MELDGSLHNGQFNSSTSGPAISPEINLQTALSNSTSVIPNSHGPAQSQRGTRGARGGRARGRGRGCGRGGIVYTYSTNRSRLVPPPAGLNSQTRNAEQSENEEPIQLVNVANSTRHQLDASTMDKLKDLPLDELRRRHGNYAKYQRLAAENKVDLEAAYIEYMRKTYLIAIKYRLHILPALKYLGLLVLARGSTNYNNFCEYDPDASKIYRNESIDPNERSRLCGRLWASVDPERKLMFDDPDFLDSLPNPYSMINLEDEEDTANPPISTEQEASSSTNLKVLKRRVKFDAHEWLQKVVRDMRNLSTSFQVEGFVVITSCNMKGPVAISGGTIIGERFLDLHSKTIDPCANFVAYQEGQAVIKTISGADLSQEKQLGRNPPVQRKEKKEGLPEKRAAVAEQLGKALYTATGGKYVKGWPGKSTIEVLKKLKITLKVNTDESRISCKDLCMRPSDMQKGHADRVLIALKNGSVELISHAPEATDEPNVVGHDPKDNGAGVVISKSFIVGPSKKKHTDSNAIQKNSSRKRKPTSSATGPASKRIKRKKNKSHHLEDLADLDDEEADSDYEGETDRSDSDHDAESDAD
ncbi:hypothetical protein PCASD_19320 [Puccinia coronata f. sp. avenae]|uniref:Uncharacterized protein n=1 Tax=Puccinia coronata f. sp. avenae TaxID=200324 RepID=A0A2N5SK00_9BASI|nr:hypothetical protein PCASD_19320 [Puccinia coronata f. sp. avenae]